MPLKFKFFNSEGGAIPFIILLASLGLIAFLVISNIFNFKDNLFNSLYPKPSSRASLILTPDNYGFNAGGVEESDPQYLSAIALTKAANIGWVRGGNIGCDWGAVQSADGKPYDWSKCDTNINNIVNVYGRSLIQSKFYANSWCTASPPVGTLSIVGTTIGKSNLEKTEPCDYQKYYDFVFAFVSRYGSVEHPEKNYTKVNGYAKGWIKYYEIGNEPDGSEAMLYYTYGQPAPSYTGIPPADLQQKMSEHYGHIVQQTYKAVKAADPNIQVLIGGLIHGSKPAPDFFNNILGNPPYTTPYSVKGFFDIMNYHCYCNATVADQKFNQVYNELKTAGVWPKPIWLTEMGTGSIYSQQLMKQYQCASTDLPSSTACQQAQANYVTDMVPHFLNGVTAPDGTLLKADKVFLSHQLDAPADSSNFCTYGVIWYGDNKYECGITTALPNPLPTLTGKLAYTAYKNLIAASISTPTPTPTPQASSTSTPTPSPTPSSTTNKDTTAPVVAISSPLNGAKLTRNTNITIQVSASDNVAVSKVEIYSNGSLICTDTSSPYSCSYKLPGKPNSSYTFKATAYDSAGNSSSASIIITAI